MGYLIYGESVQGASHIRNGVACQDSFKQVQISDEIILIAAADGHGSSSCPYSKSGSKIAVNVFCRIMEDIVNNFSEDMDFLATYLNREGELKVAKAIDDEWKRRVWKVHSDNKREKVVDENGKFDKSAVYKQYGTTLLGLMITPSFIFAFQLGDGNVMYVDKDEIQSVIECEKILGIETHSLCKADAWKKANTMIRKRNVAENIPYFYSLSTDGLANSYKSEDEFYVTLRDYYNLILEHGFDTVTANFKNWLNETSELGCGDDITLVMVYYN